MFAGDHGPPDLCDHISPLSFLMVPYPLLNSPDARVRRAWTQYTFALEKNRFTIVTWFDIYSTMRHIATGVDPGEDASAPFRWDAPDHVSSSLLKSLPQNRTCRQAGIPEWSCGCALMWQPWCPITDASLRQIATATLSEVMEQTSVFLRHAYSDDAETQKICPPLELEGISSCEFNKESMRRMEEELLRDNAEVQESFLRIRFRAKMGMEYEVYSAVEFRTARGLNVLPRQVFALSPTSRYAQHEACTPHGADPAFCLCGGAQPDEEKAVESAA